MGVWGNIDLSRISREFAARIRPTLEAAVAECHPLKFWWEGDDPDNILAMRSALVRGPEPEDPALHLWPEEYERGGETVQEVGAIAIVGAEKWRWNGTYRLEEIPALIADFYRDYESR